MDLTQNPCYRAIFIVIIKHYTFVFFSLQVPVWCAPHITATLQGKEKCITRVY